jgi:hypothetical protein
MNADKKNGSGSYRRSSAFIGGQILFWFAPNQKHQYSEPRQRDNHRWHSIGAAGALKFYLAVTFYSWMQHLETKPAGGNRNSNRHETSRSET